MAAQTVKATAVALVLALGALSPRPALSAPPPPPEAGGYSTAVAESLAVAWRLALFKYEWEKAARAADARRDSVAYVRLRELYEQQLRLQARKYRAAIIAGILVAALSVGLAYAFAGAK